MSEPEPTDVMPTIRPPNRPMSSVAVRFTGTRNASSPVTPVARCADR